MREPELHFDGREIVSPGSFLRVVPSILDREQRLRIDALVFSADVMNAHWNILRDIAAFVGSDTDKMTRVRQSILLSSAWSIIDHLNNVRQLANSLVDPVEGPGPKTALLLNLTEPARFLRNKMDHLNGNLKNLAKSKGGGSPLFGGLGYFYCPKKSEGYTVVVQAGFLHGGERATFVNPAGKLLTPPADLFQMTAFGVVFELGPPLAAFADWLEASAANWEGQMREQIATLAAASGHSIEKLMEHPGGGFTIMLCLKFGQPPPKA